MNQRRHLTINDLAHLPVSTALFIIEYCKDVDIHRAASIANIPVEDAHALRNTKEVADIIQSVFVDRTIPKKIDKDLVLHDMYNAHLIALQNGKVSVSAQLLNTIGKHADVDAFAAEKVKLDSDDAVIQRLMRREKAANMRKHNIQPSSSDSVSFL